MKTKLLLLIAVSGLLFSCGSGTKKAEQIEQEEITSVAVQKDADKKIYIHMMTWFGNPATNSHPESIGKWGVHWTMGTCNPEITDSVTGQQQIAAHYYPLTGPYASTDKDVIEYQLLLMKLSGIDGIIFNSSTLNPNWDFQMLVEGTDAIAKQTEKMGLDFAIMYEDQHVRDAENRGILTPDKITRGKLDMEYIRDTYFDAPNYIKVAGKPMLLDFGPQYYNADEWTEVFSVFGENQPAFYALNYHGERAGSNTYGEFAWIWKDYLDGLRHFYNTYEYSGDKMGVAYPGFVDFYKEGGWGDGLGWTIPHRGDSTFTETLQLALSSNVDMIQLATWNDYGEGTMLEPTVEFGFTFLSALQRELGVKNLSEKDLELVFELYQARKEYADSADIQQKLDKAADLMIALKTSEAKKIIDEIIPEK